MRISARLWHRYLGISLCLLLILASMSGILLNHRDWLQQTDFPRDLLPSAYGYHQWNQGAIKGSLHSTTHTYIYGTSGVWRLPLHSPVTEQPQPYVQGIASGADRQKVVAMTLDSSGIIWMATQYQCYRLSEPTNTWQPITLPPDLHERITDLYYHGGELILLSRSYIYTAIPSSNPIWQRHLLQPSSGHEWGTSLFRIVWAMHSGEYWGLGGKIVVDLLGLVLIALCLTGLQYSWRRSRLHAHKHKPSPIPNKLHLLAQKLGKSLRVHNKVGRYTLPLLLFVCISGWALRPPLMLLTLHPHLTPWGSSELHSSNPWHDRLRAIRYDNSRHLWLLSTASGMYTLSSWQSQPQPWETRVPISPMGITVFEQVEPDKWLIGSFSGLYEVKDKEVRNYFTDKLFNTNKMGRPISLYDIAGIYTTPDSGQPTLFLYEKGSVHKDKSQAVGFSPTTFHPQPPQLEHAPISLWQLALEIHTGRIYIPLIGKLGGDLFIPILGLLMLIVLLTGYRRLR